MITLSQFPDRSRAAMHFATSKRLARLAVEARQSGQEARGLFQIALWGLKRAIFCNTHRGPISV